MGSKLSTGNKQILVESTVPIYEEIEIDDITYCTNDDENGFIYELGKDGDVGKRVGFFKLEIRNKKFS